MSESTASKILTKLDQQEKEIRKMRQATERQTGRLHEMSLELRELRSEIEQDQPETTIGPAERRIQA